MINWNNYFKISKKILSRKIKTSVKIVKFKIMMNKIKKNKA